ncbi:MAG: hypothetical protein LIO58_07755 [Oscillospiraceae bacterium]|nr:hypothetical protein [Oscillospiraceae bacterium]
MSFLNFWKDLWKKDDDEEGKTETTQTGLGGGSTRGSGAGRTVATPTATTATVNTGKPSTVSSTTDSAISATETTAGSTKTGENLLSQFLKPTLAGRIGEKVATAGTTASTDKIGKTESAGKQTETGAGPLSTGEKNTKQDAVSTKSNWVDFLPGQKAGHSLVDFMLPERTEKIASSETVLPASDSPMQADQNFWVPSVQDNMQWSASSESMQQLGEYLAQEGARLTGKKNELQGFIDKGYENLSTEDYSYFAEQAEQFQMDLDQYLSAYNKWDYYTGTTQGVQERLDALDHAYNMAYGVENQEKRTELESERMALRLMYDELDFEEQYGSLQSDPDFATYVAKGAAIETPDNMVRYVRENPKKAAVHDALLHGMADSRLQNLALTQEETENYNYLLGKYGTEKAQGYLDALTETLNRRVGEAAGQSMRGIENDAGRAMLTGFYSFGSGLTEYGDDMKQLFHHEALPTSATQYASGYIRDDLQDAGPAVFGNSMGQIAYDLGHTVGYMTPSIAASLGTGSVGAAVLTGFSSAGGAYNSALKSGHTAEQAQNYAVLSGVAEGGMQFLLSGISKLGGKVSGKVAEALTKNIGNALLRATARTGLSVLSEGTEEYLQTLLDPVLRNLCLDENNELKLVSEEALYSALLGMMTAGVVEGGGKAAGKITDTIMNTQSGELAVENGTNNQTGADLSTYIQWAAEYLPPEYIDLAYDLNSDAQGTSNAVYDTPKTQTNGATETNTKTPTQWGDYAQWASQYLPSEYIDLAYKIHGEEQGTSSPANEQNLLPETNTQSRAKWSAFANWAARILPSEYIDLAYQIHDNEQVARPTSPQIAGAQATNTQSPSTWSAFARWASKYLPSEYIDMAYNMYGNEQQFSPIPQVQESALRNGQGEQNINNQAGIQIPELSALPSSTTPVSNDLVQNKNDSAIIDENNTGIVDKGTSGADDKTYSPINPGPLSEKVANSFNGATYNQVTLVEDTTLYRVYGGNANEIGGYWSLTPQNGGLQSQLDLALNPSWGNTAKHVTQITVPAGTTIYTGTAAPQNILDSVGNIIGSLPGGGRQVYILEVNPSWLK